MMADNKTAVIVAGEDGKPKQVASFDSKSDAAYFARQRITRYGRKAYVGPAGNKDAIAKAIAPDPATRPLNSGMDARVAAMRAQVMQEQTDAEIRSAVEGETELSDDVTEAIEASAATPDPEPEATEAKAKPEKAEAGTK
jgi:hypothetical protein